MTPADPAELSAQLARALGYYPESVRIIRLTDGDALCQVFRLPVYGHSENPRWMYLDYRDPSVAMGVLEWLMREHDGWICPERNGDCFTFILSIGWHVVATHRTETDTLHEAIARAAIAVADEKRQRVEQNEAREVLQP